MLNLLPKNQKSKIVREYRIRFVAVACSLFLAAEIISLILLFPSYLTVQTRINILNSQSTSQKVQNLTTEIASLGSIIQQTNNYLDVFNSSSTPVGVVESLQNIIGTRDKTIRIGSFYYKTNKEQQQIVITGKANSRQSLLDFTKKLKNLPGVVSVDLPVSDFAKSKDIDFSINILMNSQHT
jgi:hypothetical protein